MRSYVRQLLRVAADKLELSGPAALIASGEVDGTARQWLEQHFTATAAIECRLPAAVAPVSERQFDPLPIAPDSLGTLLCLDLVCRFEETADLLEIALPLLAPGGLMIITANVADARPEIGMSRVLTPLGLERIVAGLDAAIVGWQGEVDFPSSLILVACRGPVPARFGQCAGQFIEALQRAAAAQESCIPWPVRAWRLLERRVKGHDSHQTPRAVESSFSVHLPSATDWRAALLNGQSIARGAGPRSERD